jgi:hypothetical protein
VTVSGDNTARIWDAETFTALTEPLQHRGSVPIGDFSRDGRWLVTGSVDETARVWSVESGLPATEPLRHWGSPAHMSLNFDNRWLAVGEVTGGVYLYELPPLGSSAPPWLIDLAEGVACERVTDTGFDAVPPTQVLEVAKHSGNLSDADPWQRFLRWFLSDRSSRTLSPSSKINQKTLIEHLIGEASYSSLRDAQRFAPENGAVRMSLARMAVLEDGSLKKNPWQDIDYHRMWALDLPEAGWLRAAMTNASNPSAVLAEMREAETARQYNFHFYRIKGMIAMRAREWEEALAAHDRAMQMMPESETVRRTYTAIARRNTLLRLGRRAAAAANYPFPLEIPPRDPAAEPRQIDLSNFYNAGVDESWHEFNTSGNSLEHIPRGLVRLGGTTFDIRGIVQLGAPEIDKVVVGYPEAALGIPVHQRCQRLHFLHAAGWTSSRPAGEVIGRYRISYADGGEASVPIVIGDNIDDWWQIYIRPGGPQRASIAWKGSTPAGTLCALFDHVWENPSPSREIAAIDFISDYTVSAPFLVAVTAE